MTNEELFRSLAGVDPAYLEHSETGVPGRRRSVTRLVLLAAVTAALSFAVFGASLIRNYLTEENERVINNPGVALNVRGDKTPQEGWLALEFSADADPDRPEWIEKCYLPMYFVENWESESMEISQMQNTEEWKAHRPDVRFTWVNSEGQYAIYRQTPIPVLNGEDSWPYDEVQIGYNETVEIERRTIGEFEVLQMEVPPSSLETENMLYTHPGCYHYFWSDGEYVFALEVSFEVQHNTVEQALVTMTLVEDPDEYRTLIEVESVEKENTAEENLTQGCAPVLIPGWLPESWEQELGRIQENNCVQFEWRYYPEGSSVWSSLTLEQGEVGDFDRTKEEYESSTAEYTRLERSVLGWNIIVYCRDNLFEAFWTTGDSDYNLSFRGREGLNSDEFIRILDELIFVEDYTKYMTQ